MGSTSEQPVALCGTLPGGFARFGRMSAARSGTMAACAFTLELIMPPSS